MYDSASVIELIANHNRLIFGLHDASLILSILLGIAAFALWLWLSINYDYLTSHELKRRIRIALILSILTAILISISCCFPSEKKFYENKVIEAYWEYIDNNKEVPEDIRSAYNLINKNK